jgi:hypothetical protein
MTIFVQPVASGIPLGVAGVYDYFSLSQSVQDWFARSDLSNYIDYFIQKAEQAIYRDIFTAHQGTGTKDLETALSTTINASGQVPLPTGYLGLKYMLVSACGQTFQLNRRNAEFIYTQYPSRTPDSVPAYVARDGQFFSFGPFPDAEYAITGIYWQKFAQLTSTNTVTWMTATIPDVLLAAACKAAAQFNRDDEGIQLWDGEYKAGLEAYLMADRAEELSGSSFAMVAG